MAGTLGEGIIDDFDKQPPTDSLPQDVQEWDNSDTE